MTHQSLEEALQAAESPVEMLRNSQTGPYAFPGTAEFTNWRDEQRAWRETCVLFEQSFHMTDLYIEGPDALRLLSDFGINNFENFEVNKAKQFVACNHDGYVIGDAISSIWTRIGSISSGGPPLITGCTIKPRPVGTM